VGDVVQLGPLVIASERLLAVVAVWMFLALATWHSRRHTEVDGRVPWLAVLVGILTARLAFVLQSLGGYRNNPLEALYLWQGGFSPLFGVAAGAIVLALIWKGPGRVANLSFLIVIGSVSLVGLEVLRRDQVRPLPEGLTAIDMAAQRITLKQLQGKPFVLNLWATWCPPCLREMPMLAEVAAGSPEVPVLLVNQGEDMATVRAFLRRQKLAETNVLLDPVAAFGAAMNSPALPTTLFVDADGRIRQVQAGEISRAALLAGIEDIKETTE
jgi:cytochrome c biogenesis protein CcmG, thiol:disulfide interchange protein DsbE